MLDKVKRLCEWGEWEQHEFDQCGCRIRQATDKSVAVNKRDTPERSVSSQCLHTDASTCQKPCQRKNTQR